MKQYKITVGERTFYVKLLSDPRQAMVQVEVDGRHMDVRVQSAETEPSVATSEAAPPLQQCLFLRHPHQPGSPQPGLDRSQLLCLASSNRSRSGPERRSRRTISSW